MSKRQKGRATAQRRKGGVAAHPAFAAILGLWGALLAGLATIVLPQSLFDAAAIRTGLGVSGSGVQIAAALLAALILGTILYALAAVISRKAGKAAPSVAEAAAGRTRTIDPVRDLGSQSLDAPITAMPFAAAEPETASADDASLPRALDLAEFAALPGRNAVWVEEAPAAPGAAGDSADEPAPPLTRPALATSQEQPRRQRLAPAPVVGAAALARLRSTPTQELSLIEMVERFAGALHDHRSLPQRPVTSEDAALREAALAEALRALAALSGKDVAPAQAQPLHDALARLQGLRGAA